MGRHKGLNSTEVLESPQTDAYPVPETAPTSCVIEGELIARATDAASADRFYILTEDEQGRTIRTDLTNAIYAAAGFNLDEVEATQAQNRGEAGLGTVRITVEVR